jgi:hypothetical protein
MSLQETSCDHPCPPPFKAGPIGVAAAGAELPRRTYMYVGPQCVGRAIAGMGVVLSPPLVRAVGLVLCPPPCQRLPHNLTSHNYCVIQHICWCISVQLPCGFRVWCLHWSRCCCSSQSAALAVPSLAHIRARERPLSLQHCVLLMQGNSITTGLNTVLQYRHPARVVALLLLKDSTADKIDRGTRSPGLIVAATKLDDAREEDDRTGPQSPRSNLTVEQQLHTSSGH